MKRIAIAQLPYLFVLLIAAALAGAAFAQQAPPGQTLRQAGDMIPDASTISAFAARTATADSAAQARDTLLDTVVTLSDQIATADSAAQARDMLPDTVTAFAARSATAANTSQAVYLLPEVTFAARSTTAAIMPQAEYLLPDVTFVSRSATVADMPLAGDMIPDVIAAGLTLPTLHQADGPTQESQTAQLAPAQYDSPGGLVTLAQATELGLPAPAAAKEMAAQSAQTAQLAPSHFDDSLEARDASAAMRAMAAIHVPSMEAIRLALASARAAAEAKAQGSQTARLATSHYAALGAVTSAQATLLGLPALASAKAAAESKSQVAILAEAGSQMAILQANRPAQGSQNPQLTSSHYAALGALTSAQARALGLPALASAKAAAEAKAQGSQNAQLASSHYAALGALTSAQARALGLPALAGIKEVAEERYLTTILQNPTLLALVQAEEASQSQHVGLTVGELARLARDESQHEATESPIEAAFEAAEAAHNPGVSMLQVLP